MGEELERHTRSSYNDHNVPVKTVEEAWISERPYKYLGPLHPLLLSLLISTQRKVELLHLTPPSTYPTTKGS